jgi:hypothetical protein
VIFIIWLALVIAYLIWAIHFYVYNFGLSNKEWKTLYPELYARKGEKTKFIERRDSLMKAVSQSPEAEEQESDAPAAPETKPFEEPEANPYQQESFGLPPGTIRGMLALTALVMFLLVEGVNLYAPGNLEGHFDGLITALEMVLAFYFGSKAVQALQAKTNGKAAPAGVKPEAITPSVPEAAPAAEPKPPEVVPPVSEPETPASPADSPAMSYTTSAARVANIIAVRESASVLPATGLAITAGGLSSESPLLQRVLSMTASFETSLKFPDCFGATTGNFDGQGISFGALQWNLGQGSLQPILRAMRQRYRDQFEEALGDLHAELSSMLDLPKEDQLSWAKRIQYTRSVNNRTIWYLTQQWKDGLKKLGTTPGMIQLQVENADTRFQTAVQNCVRYGLTTERGAALMFDINVQNGAVDSAGAGGKIRQDFATIDPGLPEEQKQVEKMKIVATRRSEVANPQWRDDVKRRKMTIAEGTGIVHGKTYDLGHDFVIRLDLFMKGSPAASDEAKVA